MSEVNHMNWQQLVYDVSAKEKTLQEKEMQTIAAQLNEIKKDPLKPKILHLPGEDLTANLYSCLISNDTGKEPRFLIK